MLQQAWEQGICSWDGTVNHREDDGDVIVNFSFEGDGDTSDEEPDDEQEDASKDSGITASFFQSITVKSASLSISGVQSRSISEITLITPSSACETTYQRLWPMSP